MMVASRPEDGITRGNPFPKGTGGSNSFRIPALVTLSDGTLVAAADARWNTTYDGGGLDTVVSRSEDNGKTWHYHFANYLGDNGNAYNGSLSSCFIDPALIAAKDDRLWLLVDLYPYGVALNGSGNTAPAAASSFNSEGKLLLTGDDHKTYGYFLDGSIIRRQDGSAVPGYSVDDHFFLLHNGEVVSNLFFADCPFKVTRTGYLYLTSSADRGRTWSSPMLLNVKREGELVCLAAPGRGLVTRKGKWIFPVYRYNGSTESQRMSFLYSDDGMLWKRSADFTGADWSSESAAVELADGTLRFFYRNGSSELCYADHDPEEDVWGKAVHTGIPVNSNCQLSAIVYSEAGSEKQTVLVSSPAGPRGAGSNMSSAAFRVNGRLFAFAVETDKTLKKLGSIAVTDHEMQFLYSCLTKMRDGRVGILFEDHENRWGAGDDCYCTMRFECYDISSAMGSASDN